jgi:hypothetical protein
MPGQVRVRPLPDSCLRQAPMSRNRPGMNRPLSGPIKTSIVEIGGPGVSKGLTKPLQVAWGRPCGAGADGRLPQSDGRGAVLLAWLVREVCSRVGSGPGTIRAMPSGQRLPLGRSAVTTS